MPTFLAPLRLMPVAAVLTLAALTPACGSGPSSTADPTPVSSSVPSDVSIDLELADKLYKEGDYEQALTIYSAAAQNGTYDQKRQGLWALARIQSSRGEHNAAERTVKAYREAGGPEAHSGAAALLLGKAQFAQGDFEGAGDTFSEYVDSGGPAWPYALLYLGQIAAQRGDQEEAVRLYDQALQANLPAGIETESLLALARVQQKSGDNAAALAAYQRAVDAAPTTAASADALARLAEGATQAGDAGLTAESLRTLIVEYPASTEALGALDDPAIVTDSKVTTRDRALVLFRNRENGPAAAAFQAIVDAGTGVGEAHYYLGVLAERAEQWDEAIAQYAAAISSGESAWVTAQATWDQATVLERLGRTDEAIAGYAGVAGVLPTHDEAAPGVFRAGLLSYQLGRPGDALRYWQVFLDIAPDAEERARANYWLAKASEALGDPSVANEHYQAAIDADTMDFYALRARAVLTGEASLPETAGYAPPDADWPSVEQWLTEAYGPEDTGATQAVFAGEPWLRAVELVEAGYDDRADQELRTLIDENNGHPWLLYRLVRRIGDLDRPWVSSPAAFSLMKDGAPPDVVRLAYPLEYYQLAQAEASANGFSPFLLLALVRQESLYDPSAASPAEALGLTQVIPTTADGIAADLGVEGFTHPDLLRPKVSLQFGAHYLGGLLEGFGGVIPAALAGYNGGPANSGRWWEASGGDPDLFVESIEYPETRAYVELVMENYARYLWAYGVVEEPFLP